MIRTAVNAAGMANGRKKLRRWNMQLREIDKWTLERRKEEERGGSYLHTHEESPRSGESRDKHVTTPTPPFRTDLDTPIPTLHIKTSLFFFFQHTVFTAFPTYYYTPFSISKLHIDH
jgi:hypothetical protein